MRRQLDMTATIRKSAVKSWGYTISGKYFRNIAPTVGRAIEDLQSKYGGDIRYRVIEEPMEPAPPLPRRLKALKAVLLLRGYPAYNRYDSKEEQIQEALAYYDDETLDRWLCSLLEDRAKTPEELEQEREADLNSFLREELARALDEEKGRNYTPSSAARDYGPANPWDAPGMSVKDFI